MLAWGDQIPKHYGSDRIPAHPILAQEASPAAVNNHGLGLPDGRNLLSGRLRPCLKSPRAPSVRQLTGYQPGNCCHTPKCFREAGATRRRPGALALLPSVLGLLDRVPPESYRPPLGALSKLLDAAHWPVAWQLGPAAPSRPRRTRARRSAKPLADAKRRSCFSVAHITLHGQAVCGRNRPAHLGQFASYPQIPSFCRSRIPDIPLDLPHLRPRLMLFWPA